MNNDGEESLGELLRSFNGRKINKKIKQNELAKLMGVSVRTLRTWENDEAYPKPENLRNLIKTYLSEGVFIRGREVEEASKLWNKVKKAADGFKDYNKEYPRFDEVWFLDLLRGSRPFLAPRLPNYFVGREKFFQTLKQKILRTKEVTISALHGKPGVGKTTIALALAWDKEILSHFDGGVLWASLGPIPNLDGWLNLWGSALNIDTTRETDTKARAIKIQTALKGKSYLLIIDDVWYWEHIAIFSRIMCPNSVQLITTRDESLAKRFSPQDVNLIDELVEADSIELLEMICPQLSQQKYKEKTQKLVRYMGGLPLTLTLVGGFIADRNTFPQEIDEALSLIVKTEIWLDLTESERNISVQEIITLSIDMLPDDNIRKLFASLAVFAPKPASFSVDAIQTISTATLSQIGILVRRNLLEKINDERVMIHQVLAVAAGIQAEVQNLLFSTRVRHAEYYLEFIKANTENWEIIEREWLQVQFAWSFVSKDLGNLETAIDFAKTAIPLQEKRGMWEEQSAWCKTGATIAHRLKDNKNEAFFLNRVGWCYQVLGDRQQALKIFDNVLQISKENQNIAEEALALNGMGIVYRKLGDVRKSLHYHEQALSIFTELDDINSQAETLNSIGLAYNNLGENTQSVFFYEKAIELIQKTNYFELEGTLIQNLAGTYINIGDIPEALELLKKALIIHQRRGNIDREAQTLTSMGVCYVRLNEFTQAFDCYQKALPLRQKTGDRAGLAVTLNNLGSAYRKRGDSVKALMYLEQALSIRREIKDLRGEAVTLFNIGLVYQMGKNYKQALFFLEEVVRIDKKIEHPDLEKDRQVLELVRQQMLDENL